MIRRLPLPVDREGREIASISVDDGKCFLAVDIEGSDPDTWGIMLSDLMRQIAIAFECEGIALNGKLLNKREIEVAIKTMLDIEFAKPTDSIEPIPSDGGN